MHTLIRRAACVAVLLTAIACTAPAALAWPASQPVPTAGPWLSVDPTPSPTASPPVLVPRVTLKASSGVWLGDAVTLTVTVEPALAGAPVVVERLRDGAWEPVASGALDVASRARIDWLPDAFGPVRLRASLAAGDGYTAAVSGTRRLIVNRPNRHRVPYRFAHYIVIVVHEYKLYYYEHGRMVRDFTVALGRPGYRTPIGTFRIFGKRKPAGGALGACAMFYRREGGIAIHGTNQPHLLRRFPRPFSHGCARMYNSQVLWLYARVPTGTTVHNIP
jgi:lipoprotein-anchoring transpeptidase ErfK/SrfK